MKKIIIEQDKSCDMLSISTEDGTCLFYGNTWDFDRSGSTFKELFQKLGYKVDIQNKNMSDE